MRRFALILLLPVLLGAVPQPSPSPHRRYRIGDLERRESRRSFLASIANALPVTLAIWLGLRSGNVRIHSEVGPVRVIAGQESSASR